MAIYTIALLNYRRVTHITLGYSGCFSLVNLGHAMSYKHVLFDVFFSGTLDQNDSFHQGSDWLIGIRCNLMNVKKKMHSIWVKYWPQNAQETWPPRFGATPTDLKNQPCLLTVSENGVPPNSNESNLCHWKIWKWYEMIRGIHFSAHPSSKYGTPSHHPIFILVPGGSTRRDASQCSDPFRPRSAKGYFLVGPPPITWPIAGE
jgi:hypothetical protein